MDKYINEYYKDSDSIKIDLDEYLYKIVDSDGRIIYRECRFKRIWSNWINDYRGKGYKLYAYTKTLKPINMLIAW